MDENNTTYEEQVQVAEETSVSEEENVQAETQEEVPQSQNNQNYQKKRHEPKAGHPRFNEIYRDNKVKGRTIEEQKNQIDELAMTTKKLQDRLEEFQNTYHVDKVSNDLSTIKKRMKMAVEDQDTKAFDILQTQYDKKYEEMVNPKPVQQSNPALTMFKQYNPWYGVDTVKTQYALNVDASLKTDPYWGDVSKVSTDQFLAEVARRTNSYYSGGVGYQTEGVVSKNVTSNNSGRNSAAGILSAAERKIAEKLMPEMAKEDAYKNYAQYKINN